MSERSPVIPARRVWQLVGGVVLVVLAFGQGGSLTSPDTKLDLLVDPLGFMARSVLAWDPQAAFGQVQNQAYGYLWPMGPFFAAGDLLQLPPWVIQRLWWSVLLLVAYLGMLRLLALWGVGTPTTRIVAAGMFALSPRVLSVMGTISAEAWPLAVLPWILIPLVRGCRGGDPRRAALLSAIAVGCLGAVNAVASLWAIVPAALYLLTRERGARRAALARWWSLGVLLASLWWVVPLLVQSRVASPFLSFIESAQVTTAPTSALNALRGAAQWLAYAGGGGTGAVWDAGGWLATSRWGILATAAVAALGVVGLAGRNGGERRFLAMSAAVGVMAVGIGYAGALGGPLAPVVQSLLDGPLAPLRNVHKADPLIRLPLAVGLATALAALPRAVLPWAERLFLDARPDRDRQLARVAAAVVVAPLLALAVLPALQGRLAAPGSLVGLPPQWEEVADEVAAVPGTTLLVPSSNFAAYSWGRPLDEPLAPLASSPWAVRNAVPLGSPGATRWLDEVQAVLAGGVGSDRLAPALRAAGVSRVVLRNDLDPFTPAPPSAAARAALIASPGVVRVAGFGPPVLASAGLDGFVAGVGTVDALEVFEVAGAVTDAEVIEDPLVVVGGPEVLAGQLAGARALLAPDTGQPADVVTDTYRLRSQNFGAERGRDLTPTLDPTADARRGRPAIDVTAWPADTPRAALVAPTGVVASSTAADPFAVGYAGPATGPESAADGDPTTAWLSAVGDSAPRWSRTFGARPIGAVAVDVVRDPAVANVSEVVVEAGGREARAPVPDDGRVTVDLGGVMSDHVTISLVATGTAPTAVREVTVDGVEPVLRVVSVPGSAPAARLAAASGGRRDCVRTTDRLFTCAPASAVQGEEDAGWARQLTVSEPADLVGATVALRPSAEAGELLDRALGRAVTGTGTWLDDPAARPGAALDADPATAWLVRPGADDAVLTVTYPAAVTVSGVSVRAELPDGRIGTVSVSGGGQVRTARLDRRGFAVVEPLTAERITVRVAVLADRFPTAPVRISEIGLIGAPVPNPDAIVRVPCGEGPRVRVGTTVVPLAVTARASELVAGAAVPATPCAEATAEGETTVVAPSTAVWRVASVDIGAVASPVVTPVATDRTSAESAAWTVGPGPAGRVLATTWGFNRGWQASAGGVPLTAVQVDGWRQGWVLPASATGLAVTAEFPAGRWHRAGLVAGLAAWVVLLALLVRRSRPVALTAVGPAAGARGWALALALVAPVVVAGVAGLIATALLAVVARRGRRPRAAALVGGAALLLSGAVAAVVGPSWGAGAGAGASQAMAAVAVAGLAWLACADRPATGRSG